MTSDNPLLERVRKLLAKAEAQGVTPAEAEALTAKAAELMARYGIDRALLAAQQPETDHPADRKVDIDNPWARVQAHLLCGLASAMRCQCVILPRSGPGTRIHMFGFASDIERTDVLYTSLLVQMWQGLAATGRAGLDAQPAGVAAQLAAGLHLRGGGAGSVPPSSRPLPRPMTSARMRGRARSWCWPTGRRSSSTASSTPTRSPARPG